MADENRGAWRTREYRSMLHAFYTLYMNTALCSTRSMLMHLVRGYALYANALVRGLLKEYNSQKNNTLSVYEYRSILYALYPLCMNKNNALRALSSMYE